jgi:hypothetical protein
MLNRNVCLLAALLALGATEAAAQTRCYIWRDGRRVECQDDRRDRERDRERRREEERRRERERERARDRARSHGLFGWAEPAQFGVRGGYDFEDDAGMAGAQLRIPLGYFLTLAPSGDVFFGDSPNEWQINTDLLVRPLALGGLYGGIGAAFLNREFDLDDSETEVGLNLILGLESGRIRNTTLRPFVEGRWTTVEDYDAFRLAAGFNVPISGRR